MVKMTCHGPIILYISMLLSSKTFKIIAFLAQQKTLPHEIKTKAKAQLELKSFKLCFIIGKLKSSRPSCPGLILLSSKP